MPTKSTKCNYLPRYAILRLLCIACLIWLNNAFAFEDLQNAKWTYQVGVDSWKLAPSIAKDSYPGFSEENTNLFLPNSASKWNYTSTAMYGWVTLDKPVSLDSSLNVKARADQSLGLRVDEAALQTYFSPFFGIRVGVVDYKTSWCRNYESTSGWIRDIETICGTPQFRDVSGGAPGLQIFTSISSGDYLVQTQVGFYNPLLFNYAPKEFGNLIPSDEFKVSSNKKVGFNVNVLNINTGVETRLSYIKIKQRGFSPEPYLLGANRQESDLMYLGLNLPVQESWNLRITNFLQYQKNDCVSVVAELGSSCNLNLKLKKQATSIEIGYRANANNLISIGLSNTQFMLDQTLFNPAHDQSLTIPEFYIHSNQRSIAWRHDWTAGAFTTIQYLHSRQKNSYTDDFIQQYRSSYGHALGLRLGYQF
jgi:hypothetical protein